VKRFLICLTVCALPAAAVAQDNPAARTARQWRQQHEHAIVDEFVALLAIPNVSRDRGNIQRNAEFIASMMRKRGIASRLVSVEGANAGNPVVFGEIRTPGAVRTIVFYAHYDGAPLDPMEWKTPPFTPTLSPAPAGPALDPELRILARSAGDDKAPIMAMMSAVDAIKSAGLKLKSNVKFAFEGEEEAGSTNLARILAANKELFAGDLWLVCDGPVHQTRRPLIYFGARDNVWLDVTVYGAKNELHSGHYGNWAPNPALQLARLLVSMKDESGRVVVDHFYDEVAPLSEMEKRALADAPDIDLELRRELELGATDGAPKKLAELITQPSLNIRGMASSRIGAAASNVIPSTASASIDVRLVKGMDPRRTQDRIIDHIRKQGFFVVERAATAADRRAHAKVALIARGAVGLGAVRTPMDLPISQEVIRVVESVRGPAVKLPNMGGTLPLAEIERPLGTRTIVIPIANHDDNQHSFDENLRLQNLWDGIELMAALLTM